VVEDRDLRGDPDFVRAPAFEKPGPRSNSAVQCPITAGQSSATHAERISYNNISIHVAAPIRQEK
jgi:hypothetical protein